jgi:hypothetical protein
MSAPQVYKAVTAVAAELSGGGIPKRHRNERDDYRYRSIDDVLNRLSPLLAKHKLCVLPRVLVRECTDRLGEGDLLLVGVALKVAFDLVSSADGSSHTVEAFGEALDASDKATAKAMSSAYKHAMLQTFCVPVAQIADADVSSHRLKRNRSHPREPVEGWAMWTSGIVDIVESCATTEAIERLRQRQRPLLTAISREKPNLYAQIGAAFAKRTAELNGERCADCEGEVARTEPPIPIPTIRGRNREAAAKRPDGERCAEPKSPRSSKPARSRPRKQTEDAPSPTPEPA